MTYDKLPAIALSVRQPWAWAIAAGHKPIENRSAGAIRAGRMDLRRIALHAASGMREAEYTWAVWKMAQVGVTVPPAEELPRRAIIGAVTVTDIISESDSPWFGGQKGLVLASPISCAPIPCPGALGYFTWTPSGETANPAAWMKKYSAQTDGLFSDLPLAWEAPPPKPFRTKP